MLLFFNYKEDRTLKKRIGGNLCRSPSSCKKRAAMVASRLFSSQNRAFLPLPVLAFLFTKEKGE